MHSLFWLEIIIMIVALLAAIFFSLAEGVINSLGTYKIRSISQEAEDKNMGWLNDLDKIKYTIIIGKVAAIILFILGTAHFTGVLNKNITLIVYGVCVGAIMLFIVELLPKNIAKYKGADVLPLIAAIVKPCYYILFPLIFIIQKIGRGFTAVIWKSDELSKITQDDIAMILDISEEEGAIGVEQQSMLSSILDISDDDIKKVMVPRTQMIAISSDLTKDEFLNVMRDNEYSRIPVYEETLDHVTGIVHVKDILKLHESWTIDDVIKMQHAAIFVPETKKINAMLKEFQQARQQMAIVVDEYGGVAGLITMEDLLEEIVGEIWDEYDIDEKESEIAVISEKLYHVEAGMNIDDFCEYFGIKRTEDMDEYDTVAGLIYNIAEGIPSVGDKFEWNGFTITIKSMQNAKLEAVDFMRHD